MSIKINSNKMLNFSKYSFMNKWCLIAFSLCLLIFIVIVIIIVRIFVKFQISNKYTATHLQKNI